MASPPPASSQDHAVADLLMLTTKELLSLSSGVLSFPAHARKSKSSIITFIIQNAPVHHVNELRDAAACKQETQTSTSSKKRKPRAISNTRQTRQQIDHPISEDEHDISKFMELPTSSEVHSCYKQFYEATSNAALTRPICAVCAREPTVINPRPSTIHLPINDIPNNHLLFPKSPHPAHDIYHGMLLDPRGVTEQPTLTEVNVCMDCFSDLQKAKDTPPKFSLANNMWIGPVPWQIQVLTFPEQLLIALLYPRVYVFKLFPKKYSGKRHPETLQRAMRGNVTTYELDSDGVASMIQGKLMPRPPAILASLITVTYVGLGKLPRNWLRTTFRVRRQFVLDALVWLQANNPKYYGDIEISSERIGQLPEDDIPEEIESLTRQSEDIGILHEENDNYVPTDADDAHDPTQSVDNEATPSDDTNLTDPDVIPLQISGTLDTDMTSLTANKIMAWGLANLWNSGQEGGYAIRHGRTPVNNFGVNKHGTANIIAGSSDTNPPNFFEKAFPALYPYGCGGIESPRPVAVDFQNHVRWSLQYHDRRFRKHETFPFTTFGILQRRQALGSARLQMQRKTFERDAQIMASLTTEIMSQSQSEEATNQPISNGAMQLLRTHVNATAACVMGSDASQYRMRSQIWSTSIAKGPPSLWITINPCDLHDPIAQVLAGEEIDLDKFMRTCGPTAETRARNVAQDPYASSQFFHFLIHTILATLFQIKTTSYSTKSKMGVLGRLAAYFGTVESQEYIKANIRAHLPGLENKENIQSIPNETDIAYSRPINPESSSYKEESDMFELKLAQAKQVHTCEIRRCLVPDNHGHLRCKCKAPFSLSTEDYIDASSNWKPQRMYGYMNSWVPSILLSARCNNDGKLLTNGGDTKNISFYVTSYAAKKQGRNYNVSAIIAKEYAYHMEHSAYLDTLRDKQRLLLFRLAHAINREQEVAAPMVISYLMGWGDTYRSHHYTPVYWSSFVGQLFKNHPVLKQLSNEKGEGDTAELRPETVNNDVTDDAHETLQDNDTQGAKHGNETLTLETDAHGNLYPKCQWTDYICRGAELEHYNVYQFFQDTWEDQSKQGDTSCSMSPEHNETHNEISESPHKRGRRRSEHIPYLSTHPCKGKRTRVRRSTGHNNIPNFIGGFFPRSDDSEKRPFYCASMLMLLKPWWNIQTDLKGLHQTWEDAFIKMYDRLPAQHQRIIAGIQYYHECANAAARDREKDTVTAENEFVEDLNMALDDPESNIDKEQTTYTEEGLANLIASQTSYREENHGRLAVEIAKHARIHQQTLYFPMISQQSW